MIFFRSAELSDAGQYECQISTEKKLSHVVSLTVTGRKYSTLWKIIVVKSFGLNIYYFSVPVLSIDGSPSILASAGSNITLRCSVLGDTHKTPIHW